jgi:hypothetical protein
VSFAGFEKCSVRAGTPAIEQGPEVDRVDEAIAVEVRPARRSQLTGMPLVLALAAVPEAMSHSSRTTLASQSVRLMSMRNAARV